MEPLRVVTPPPALYRDAKGRARRPVGLPEQVDYRDDGCEVAPACLTCPLIRCRYDEQGGVQTMATRDRREKIRAAYIQDDADVDALARRFGVSRRTVLRAIARLPRERRPVHG